LAVPGYEILGELGRGGMGVVYHARQLGLQRTVALKMVLNGTQAGPKDLARFRAEAAALARLQHPNIVQIYDVGEATGRPYFVLEFVAHGSLAQHLQGTPQPVRPAAQLVETLARAVHAAHASGVIHRDLKPANILLRRLAKSVTTVYGEATTQETEARLLQSSRRQLTDMVCMFPFLHGAGSDGVTPRTVRSGDRRHGLSLSGGPSPPGQFQGRARGACRAFALARVHYAEPGRGSREHSR
jgi:serine/threonine protein kinase